MAGAGTIQRWNFVGTKPCGGVIVFHYGRPWDTPDVELHRPPRRDIHAHAGDVPAPGHRDTASSARDPTYPRGGRRPFSIPIPPRFRLSRRCVRTVQAVLICVRHQISGWFATAARR